MKKQQSTDLVSNRKARHNFEILETFEAGMVLMGTEIKSLRDHGGSLDESYVTVGNKAATLKNAYIAHYKHGNLHNHEEKRERTLLFHKRELLKLRQAVDQKGLSLIPLAIYLKKGKAKVCVALARGKKLYDKRHALKSQQAKRDINKAVREHS